MTEQSLVFAYDPGEVSNGFAWFEVTPDEINLKVKTIVKSDDFDKHLEDMETYVKVMEIPVSAIVVENFRVRNEVGDSHRQRHQRSKKTATEYGWNEVETIRQIGAVRYHAHRLGAKIVYSETKILGMARMWVDFPVSKNPNTHIDDDISAYIHGAKYFMDIGRITSCEEIVKFGQRTLT